MIMILNDSNQLNNFKKNLSEILNYENTHDENILKNNKINNICNHPRTKNRGLCKRKCINNVYCIYHMNNNYSFQVNRVIPRNNPDDITLKLYSDPEKYEKIS